VLDRACTIPCMVSKERGIDPLLEARQIKENFFDRSLRYILRYREEGELYSVGCLVVGGLSVYLGNLIGRPELSVGGVCVAGIGFVIGLGFRRGYSSFCKRMNIE
jgi:hypothetical protein